METERRSIHGPGGCEAIALAECKGRKNVVKEAERRENASRLNGRDRLEYIFEPIVPRPIAPSGAMNPCWGFCASTLLPRPCEGETGEKPSS